MHQPLITSKPRIRMVNFFLNTTGIGHLSIFTEVLNEFAQAIFKDLDNLHQAAYLKKVALKNRISCKIKYTFFAILQKNSFPAFWNRFHCYDDFGSHGRIEKIMVTGDFHSEMMVKPLK